MPEGGSILWATYYFRDEALAEALVRAHRRGVRLTLCIEGKPRTGSANEAVIRRLKSAIGDRLRVVHHPIPLHLHGKIYGFSHPRPVALLGSFNPSGNDPEDSAIIARIGDQDRGDNLLVEIADPVVVTSLFDWVRSLHRSPLALQWRMRAQPNDISGATCQLFLFPRPGGDVLTERLEALPERSTVRIAASHIRDRSVAKVLDKLAHRNVHVEVITGGAGRRSPRSMERELSEAGVSVRRLGDCAGAPMHCKFILAQSGGERWSAFGSYNLTKTSRWLNYETLLLSRDREVWAELDLHWKELAAACAAT
nr:phosphatidylserine/phosphatidylglycerophosphate/cardiolipin synthase family protein [Sphingomonas sp. URHD0057]